MKKSKVAILTFHRAVNYGAVLQAYALQRTLFLLGYDTEILDYRNKEIERHYYSPIGNGKKIKSIIKSLLSFRVQNSRNKAFGYFVRTKLVVSPQKYTKKDIVNASYDYYITGSDQVWNLKCTDFDSVYFLDFANAEKRISYAASLGKYKDIINEYDNYLKFLRDYKWISVREIAGKAFLEKNIDREINVDLDPTFLLDRKEWDSLSTVFNTNDYILIYSVNLNSDVLTVGRKISKAKAKRLIILTLRNVPIKLQNNEELRQNASPEDFLGLIKNAACVVTNSFHGTAFSLIFDRDFYLVRNSKEDLDNTRLETLLEKFGLLDRMVEANSFANKEAIDYIKVNDRLDREKQLSISHLIQSIES